MNKPVKSVANRRTFAAPPNWVGCLRLLLGWLLLAAVLPTHARAQTAVCPYDYAITPPVSVSGTYTGAALSIPLAITLTGRTTACVNNYLYSYIALVEVGFNGYPGNTTIAGVPYTGSPSQSGSSLVNGETGIYNYTYAGGWYNSGGNSITTNLTINLPSGYVATAETTKTLRIYFWGGYGWVAGPTFTLRILVPPVLELSVAGTTTEAGVATASVDFGTMTGGALTRGLSIRSRANVAYAISVESFQGGVLRRTTACGVTQPASSDPAERQAYGVEIGGQAVTPAALGGAIGSANRFTSSTNTNNLPNSRQIIPMSVTVPAFNIAERRAGQFCAVLRLRITAQ